MVMEMNAISLGLVEAAHYWYKNLKGTFEKKTIIKAVLKTSVCSLDDQMTKLPSAPRRWMIVSLQLKTMNSGLQNRLLC